MKLSLKKLCGTNFNFSACCKAWRLGNWDGLTETQGMGMKNITRMSLSPEVTHGWTIGNSIDRHACVAQAYGCNENHDVDE